MLIHRDGWQYSGKTPAFFSGQSGCYCCGVGIGSLVSFYGLKSPGAVRIKDTDSYVIDSWTSKTDGPTPERDSAAAATVQGIAYVFGGIEGTSPFFLTSNQSYVLSTDTFTSKAAMTATRNAQAGVGIGDYAYSIGGQDGTSVPLRTTYQYDPAGNSWSTKTDTPTPPRKNVTAFALSGNGYLVGGLSDASTILKDNDQYDPSANSWTGKTDCGTQRYGSGGMAIDGKGYFMLGNDGAAPLSGVCEEYDASGNSWTTKANLSTSVPASVNRYYIGGVSPGSTSEGFAVSGFTSAAVNNHDQYAPGSDVWTVRTVIPSPARYLHACAESV
jgi:kelch-like protein 17 (actinfilin)/kelch-like protein 18